MMHFVHVLLLFVFWFYVVLFLTAPIVLRTRFRLLAKIEPVAVSVGEIPEAAQAYMEPRISEFANWNFELVAYVSLEDAAASGRTYMAFFANPHTAEWADATFVESPARKYGYIEFVTRCSEQLQIDTSNDPAAPVLFSVSENFSLRLPKVSDVFTLYRVHRMLVTEIAHGKLPVIPPAGEEMAELKRRLERVGVRQQKHGYMFLDASGENYRLTWKGAILGAWRSIWPLSLFRALRQRTKNRAILNRLGAAA
jgi:hypothetical protein